MATKPQLAIIHTLISKMGICDDDYRSMLLSFKVRSSKDLNFSDATDFVKALLKLAEQKGVPVPTPGVRPERKKRFDDLGNRPGMAYPSQMRLILARWSSVARAKNKLESLNALLLKRFHIERIEWLPREMVGKVLKTIEAMAAQEKGAASE